VKKDRYVPTSGRKADGKITYVEVTVVQPIFEHGEGLDQPAVELREQAREEG
jgi:hypothetical protein